MFLKTTELKKMMKAALKSSGLYVANQGGSYVVCASTWGLDTDIEYASNKFKAALMELIGDLPEQEESYRYYINDKGMQQETYPGPRRLFEEWKRAKTPAVQIPITLNAWPHNYAVFQIVCGEYVMADELRASGVIGPKDLEKEVESMPGRPVCHEGFLYWKNDTTIYSVQTDIPPERVRETLFPIMGSLDFFQDDWIREPVDEDSDCNETEKEEEGLPYA